MSGIYIAFEGGDFVGKSTQVKRLAIILEKTGFDFVVTKEPGGTPEGQKIRARLLHEELTLEEELELFFEDRRILVEKVLRPELARGKVVISDRSGASTVAYQGGGRGMDLQMIKERNREIYGDVVPDNIVLLDGNPGLLIKRAEGRGERLTKFEELGLDFHERVRASFLEQTLEGSNIWRVIDALQSEDEVFERVKACIPLLIPQN